MTAAAENIIREQLQEFDHSSCRRQKFGAGSSSMKKSDSSCRKFDSSCRKQNQAAAAGGTNLVEAAAAGI